MEINDHDLDSSMLGKMDGEMDGKRSTQVQAPKAPPRFKKLFLLVFGIGMFLFFLLFKLPEARIQNLIIAHIRIAAQDQGISFTAEKVRIGILMGLSMKMSGIELKSLEEDRQVLKISYLKVRPHLFSLLTGTKKFSIDAELLNGEISGVIGISNAGAVVDLDIEDIELRDATLLKKYILVDLMGTVNGNIDVNMDMTAPAKSAGDLSLKASKLTLPAQSIMGFNLPSINISALNADLQIKDGKIAIESFQAGADPAKDDIVAKVTGEGTLGSSIERTQINAKAVFQLSSKVISSFPLVEALLQPAKLPDGKYGYKLNGPITALEPVPGQ